MKLAEIEPAWREELADSWHGDPLAPVQLASVARCALGGGTLVLWPAGHMGDANVKFRASACFCKSWRCPSCAYGVAMQDLRRLQTGVLSKPWWLYCVLTVNPAHWDNPWAVYRTAGWLWDKRLRKRLERRFGKLTYVQTWEAHRSGWPHLNLLLSGEALQADVMQYPHEKRWILKKGVQRPAHWTAWRSRRLGARGRLKGKADSWTSWIEAAGFGSVKWVEIVDSPEGAACYLAKVAREIGSTVWKKTQAGGALPNQSPLNAPTHFRRIRASRGLLPTAKAELRWDECQGWHELKREAGQYEGVLLRKRFDEVDPAKLTWTELEPLLVHRRKW